MNILVFMSGGFDTYGPSRHLYDALISDLLNAGHKVHLIESHSTGKDPDVPSKFLDNPSFSYQTIETSVVKKTAFVKRYLAGVRYCFKAKRFIKKARKSYGPFDITLVQSCPWAPFAVSFAKKYGRAPTVWNIQDMFPGSSIASGVMKNRFLQWVFTKFQRIAYKKADAITVISTDMKKKVLKQNVASGKIHVIVNWYDDQTVSEVEWGENRFVEKYKLSHEKFYVQYAGTMGQVFDYKMVIEVAKLLKSYPEIELQMIGFGSQMDRFQAEAKSEGLSNIVFYPLQPQNDVSHVYSACSVCLIPLKQGVIGNSVPSKAGLLMACKRPIVTSADSDSDYCKMITENALGYAFGTDDPASVAKAILELKDHPEKCCQMGEAGFHYGHELYSRSANTGKYMDLFRKIIQKQERD